MQNIAKIEAFKMYFIPLDEEPLFLKYCEASTESQKET